MNTLGKPLWKLVAAMVVLQLVASICYPIAKAGLAIIEPFTFAFYRYLLSSTVLLTLVKLRPQGVAIERRDWPRVILLGFLIIPINQTMFLLGQSMTGAGHGAILFATTPVWVFLLAIFHIQERYGWRRLVGTLIACIGVIVVLLSGTNVDDSWMKGDLILMASVIAWGYYTILGKSLVRKYGALRITAYALAIGSAMYVPFGLYRAIIFDYSQTTLAAWGAVVYMAIGLSVVVYVIWYWLLKYLDASRIAVYHNVQPIIASGLAYVYLNEPLGTAFVIGSLVVIGGVLLTEL